MKLGIEKTAMIRVQSGISCALTEAMDDCHCGLLTAELVFHLPSSCWGLRRSARAPVRWLSRFHHPVWTKLETRNNLQPESPAVFPIPFDSGVYMLRF